MATEAVERAQRLLRPAHRRSSGRFLAEGPHVVREALDAGAAVEEVFLADDASGRAEVGACARRASETGAAVRTVPARDLRSLCDTETPQGIVAVVRTRRPSAVSAYSSPSSSWNG